MSYWHYILIIVLLAYVCICLFFYFYQESFLFHPRKTDKNFIYNFNYPYEEIYFNTPNNGRIHTLHFKAEDSKGVVLYLHGNSGSLRDWGWLYKDFIAYHYDLLIVDYRSFGKSTGSLSETNLHSDIAFIYDSITETYAEDNIIVYGRSIGTGMAVRLSSEKNPKKLVLETPYYSIAHLANQILPVVPMNILLKYKFESHKYITKVSCPIYILHGTNDNVVPYKGGLKLYHKVKDNATLFTVEGGQHNNLSQFSEYKNMLNMVLE